MATNSEFYVTFSSIGLSLVVVFTSVAYTRQHHFCCVYNTHNCPKGLCSVSDLVIKSEALNNNTAACVSLPDKGHDKVRNVPELPCNNESTITAEQ